MCKLGDRACIKDQRHRQGMYETSKGYTSHREMYHNYIPAKSFDVWPWGYIYSRSTVIAFCAIDLALRSGVVSIELHVHSSLINRPCFSPKQNTKLPYPTLSLSHTPSHFVIFVLTTYKKFKYSLGTKWWNAILNISLTRTWNYWLFVAGEQRFITGAQP